MNVTKQEVAAAQIVLAAWNAKQTSKTAPKAAKKAKKMPKKVKAARKANYDARIARRVDPARKGGAGMTKPEKSALYAALIAELGARPTTRQWNAACKKARGI